MHLTLDLDEECEQHKSALDAVTWCWILVVP
jgi:hypothetical protein